MAGRRLFEWDEANVGHIARHGIEPWEAEEVIRGADVVSENICREETRTVVVGETARGKTVVVVYTARKEKLRVVTAYPANRSQRARYRKHRR